MKKVAVTPYRRRIARTWAVYRGLGPSSKVRAMVIGPACTEYSGCSAGQTVPPTADSLSTRRRGGVPADGRATATPGSTVPGGVRRGVRA